VSSWSTGPSPRAAGLERMGFFPHVMKGESWICRKWGWRRINHQMKPEKGNNNLKEEFTIQDPG
jgi:hypothetical protein